MHDGGSSGGGHEQFVVQTKMVCVTNKVK